MRNRTKVGGGCCIEKKLDTIAQALIFVFGCAAIFMVALPATNPWQKWGYVVGLLSQPAWFYTSIFHGQIGVFLVSCIFTGSWIFGIWVRF